MLASCRSPRAFGAGRGLGALLIIGIAAGTVSLEAESAAAQSPRVPQLLQPIGKSAANEPLATAGTTGDASPPETDTRSQAEVSRAPRSLLLRRFSSNAREGGSDGWYVGLAGIALALAVCGAIVAVASRFSARSSAGAIHIVSRAGLTPKHTVYLLRVGRRVLLVGVGPQGAPSLISEMDELSEIEPDPRQGEAA
jgi:hypothetical protein